MLYGRPEQSFYLREIARAAGVGLGAVQRELARLTKAGILTRTVSGRQVYFRANQECPIFGELRDLMWKTAGLADVLREALSPMAPRIVAAFVYGALAEGEAATGGEAEVMVIGEVDPAEVAEGLARAEGRIGRPVKPIVMRPSDFRQRAKAGHPLITAIIAGPKIHLLGE